MPEARIILSQTTIYLATSAKSNTAYTAIDKALAFVRETGNLSVPLELRNAPTKLMKELNYGKNYQYAHDFDGNFVEANFLPEKIKGKIFYQPQNNSTENKILQRLKMIWGRIYKYK
jgi:putative ATPase